MRENAWSRIAERSAPRRRPARAGTSRAAGSQVVGVFAGVLFASVFALRVATSEGADAPLVLFVLPVAVCAIEFGLRGGVAGAVVAVGLLTLDQSWRTDDVGVLGFTTRATAYVLVGVLLGRFVETRRGVEAELAGHFDLSLDLCCTASYDGYFQRINRAWQTTLGHDPRELTRRPFLDFVHPDDRAATARETARLAGGNAATVSFRNRYRTADGDYRWLEWNARGIPEHDCIYAIARDVTTQRIAELGLQQQSDLLERAVRERTRALDDARLETLRRLALAAEYRDDDTYEHTERVGRTAALLALEVGLPEETAALLRRAAPLHDVGKLGIPDAILLKPGALTEGEFRAMQEHVTIGARILSEGKFATLRMGEEIALSHHERWDGTGYPAGLTGETIPLPGRLVAVADVFDALTHDRPYKEAWPVEDAVAEVVDQAGRHFEPRVVDAFAALDHERLLAPVAQFDVKLAAPAEVAR